MFEIVKTIFLKLSNPVRLSPFMEVTLDTYENELLTENRAKAKDTAWQYRGKSGRGWWSIFWRSRKSQSDAFLLHAIL